MRWRGTGGRSRGSVGSPTTPIPCRIRTGACTHQQISKIPCPWASGCWSRCRGTPFSNIWTVCVCVSVVHNPGLAANWPKRHRHSTPLSGKDLEPAALVPAWCRSCAPAHRSYLILRSFLTCTEVESVGVLTGARLGGASTLTPQKVASRRHQVPQLSSQDNPNFALSSYVSDFALPNRQSSSKQAIHPHRFPQLPAPSNSRQRSVGAKVAANIPVSPSCSQRCELE